MAYGDILEYNGKKYRCINPNLTSNKTPAPYYANASSEYIYNAATGHGHAFCVFTDPPAGVPETEWSWSPSSPPNWIGLYFGKQVNVDLIEFASNAKTRSITIQGSNNGSKMVNLKSFTYTCKHMVPYYVELPEKMSYSYYRIHTSSNSGGWNGYASINFYQKIDEKYLLEMNGGCKTIRENVLQETVRGNIATEGFSDLLQIKDVYEMLDETFSILRYSPDGANNVVQVGYLPDVQLVKPVGDIDLSSFSNIKQMTLVTTGNTGVIKMALSFDKGKMWKTCINGAWKEIRLTVEDIMPEGITAEILSAIPSNQWTTVKTNTLRVAYCLSKAAVTDDMAIDVLTITGDTTSWERAGHMTEYDYEYPNTTTLVVHLLSDGSYKINRME